MKIGKYYAGGKERLYQPSSLDLISTDDPKTRHIYAKHKLCIFNRHGRVKLMH